MRYVTRRPGGVRRCLALPSRRTTFSPHRVGLLTKGGIVKRVVDFALDHGRTLAVEVDEPASDSSVEEAVRPWEASELPSQPLEAALDPIGPAADMILGKLTGLAHRPDEVGVRFGIKLGGDRGAFVASADREPHYTVTLTWRREGAPPGA